MVVARGEYHAGRTELSESVSLGEVNAGLLGTEPFSDFVDPSTFRDVVEGSLRNNGYLDPSNAGRYKLDVDFINMRVPAAGLNMTGTCMIDYILNDTVTQTQKLKETIESKHTEGLGTLSGYARSKKATEGAIRKNLQELIERLSRLDDSPSGSRLFQPRRVVRTVQVQ
jgi:hypothetical protein